MKKARRRRNKPTVKARAGPRRLKQLGLGSFCRIAYIGLAVALLPLALLASLDYSPHVDSLQTIYWFHSYEHGYVQRGLWGTIISYFYDSPSIAEIHPLILRLEKIIIIATIFMTWALLVLKIWMGRFSAEKKLMLVAFAGVFMLAPVWKMFGHIAGFGDEWAFFFALLALISFIGKLPYFYTCFIIIAYLCHPQGVLYACLLTVFIAHSILRNPAYAQRWRAWVIAVLMPFCAVAVLYSITSQEALTLIYEQYSDEFLRIMPPETVSGMLKGSSERGGLSMSRTLLEIAASSHGMIAYSATLGLPVLVYAALLAYAIGNRTTSSKTEFFAGQPIVSKLIPYERYIVIVGSSFFTAPMLIAGGDWERFFHLSWIGTGMAMVYFLWFPQDAQPSPGAEMKKSASRSIARKKLATGAMTALMMVWAYVFAGAPLVVFGRINDVCKLCQNTTYFLNKNPLGERYSQAIYDVHADGNATIQLDGREMYGFMQIFGYDDILYSLENDKLLISGDLKDGWIFEKYVLTRGGQDIVVEFDYEGGVSNPVVLKIYNQQIHASYVDKNKIIWKFRGPERSKNLYYKLFSRSGQDYKIVNFSITMSDR